MLVKRLKRKITISIAALFSLFLVFLIPNNSINPEVEITYINKDLRTTNIYLLNKNNRLGRIGVNIESNDTIGIAKEVLNILISGGIGENRIPSGFRSVLNSETRINDVSYENSILYVDLSDELLDTTKDLEELSIESIIYSLTEIEDVSGIILSINNEILKYLPKSDIVLPDFLNRNYGINKIFDITSLKDINHVTIYYIDKVNDDYYYVPVTKYVNDDRDKITIIIDDLTSSKIYNTDLMSFLNSNTKLLEVQNENNVMELTFNNYILNNFDKKDILEEVIYTICLSIKDNYDVEEVIFNVDDEEIYKSVLKSIE